MRLEIQPREAEGIAVLHLRGRLVLGPDDLLLRERLAALLAQGVKRVILNLKEISAIDAAGLGTLVFCAETFELAAGRLVLTNLNPDHVSILNLFKLDTTLEIYSEEQDAVNSFFPERRVPHYDLLQIIEEMKEGPPRVR